MSTDAPTNGGTRSTDAILRDTLAELMDREEKLGAFVDEHKRVRHAIQTVEKALAPPGGKRKASSAASGDDSPRAKAIVKIKDALRGSFDPLGTSEIATATGLKDGAWLQGLISQMVAAGDAVEVEGKYGVPVPAATP